MARLNKKNKIIIGIAVCIVAGLVITGYVLAYRYKAIIHKVLPVAMADATDSLYRISVKNVSINMLNRSVTLKGVHLWADSTEVARRTHDSTSKPIYLDVRVPRLTVSGIMWDKLTGGEGYSCSEFSIIRPEITIYKTDSMLTIYDTANGPPIEREFSAGVIKLVKGKIRYALHTNDDTSTLSFNGCHIVLNDWKLSDESLKERGRILLAEYARSDIASLVYAPRNSDYTFSANNIRFNSGDNNLTARDIHLKPRLSDETLFKKMDRQKEIYRLDFPTLELTNIDRSKLLHEGELHASAIYLNHCKLDILMNRKLPPNTKSKMGNYPNQLLYKLKLPVYIEKLKINNGSLTYAEIIEKTGQKGTINFTDIKGSVNNITNIPGHVAKDAYATVKLEGKFNKYTDIKATFRFLLNDPIGSFTMYAEMGSLQNRQINEQAKAFSMIELKSFNMKSMNLQLKGDEHGAQGNFTMLYNNLGIRILKKPENIEDGKRKKGLLTFIANNMVLYSNNPMPGEEVRKVQTKVERDEMKSFFNLVWKNILQGVQATAIRDLEVIDWIRNNEQEAADKNTQIREFFTKDRKERKERRQKKREQNQN
ncbi:MAG: hypothetical protein H3C54_05515 [Taibaiella sp.]|nr:hypothetical protein [Taibaiella sp.]